MDLIIIVILSLILAPLVILTTGPLRIALGLLFVVFFPGYTLLAAVFPRKSELGDVERVLLSFGLSIAAVVLMGVAMTYTPWWSNHLYTILTSIFLFIAITAGIAWYRRHRLPAEERFEPQLRLLPSSLFRFWTRQGRLDNTLSALVVIAVIGVIATSIYVVAKPPVGEKFTEFYITGTEGEVGEYLRIELTLGEEGGVTLGIVNHEYRVVVYKVEVTIDGEGVGEVGPVTLNHEAKWEGQVAFTPTRAGPNQKVEFLLYKGEGTEPYLTHHLWVDVKKKST